MVNYLEVEGKALAHAVENTYENHKTVIDDLCLLGILGIAGGSLLKGLEAAPNKVVYPGTEEFERLTDPKLFRDAVNSKPKITTKRFGDPEVWVTPFKGGSEWSFTLPDLSPLDRFLMGGDNWKTQVGDVTMSQRANLLTFHHPDVGTVELDKVLGTANYYSPAGVLQASLNRLGHDIEYNPDGSIKSIGTRTNRTIDINRTYADGY